MLERLRQRYLKEQFEPGWLALLINPFFFARRGLFHHIRELGGYVTGKTLDVGCGQKPYEHLCAASQYIGLEIDTPENRTLKKADIFYTGSTFPFQDDEFDSILCNQVLEHVFTPSIFLKELSRVLKPGGTLLLTVPFVWDEHEQPVDFARYSSFGLAAMLKDSGFEIIEARKSVNDFRLLVQLLNAYLHKKTLSRFRILNLAAAVLLMGPVNIVGSFFGLLFPSNDDLYLDNVVLARKTTHA